MPKNNNGGIVGIPNLPSQSLSSGTWTNTDIFIGKKVVASSGIVSDGLITWLDAENSFSYPGSGTVWSDMSGNGYHYNVVASTFQSSSPKHFAFQTGGGGIAKSQNTSNIAAPTSYTFMVWTRVRNSTNDWRTLYRPYANDHQVLNQAGGWEMGAYDNDEGAGFLSSGFDQRNLPNYPGWVCLYFKFSRTTSPNWQMSWNDTPGTVRASINDIRACPPLMLGNLGGWGNGTTTPSDFSQPWGDISAFYMWNKHLTSSELLQCFNSTRTKFGL